MLIQWLNPRKNASNPLSAQNLKIESSAKSLIDKATMSLIAVDTLFHEGFSSASAQSAHPVKEHTFWVLAVLINPAHGAKCAFEVEYGTARGKTQILTFALRWSSLRIYRTHWNKYAFQCTIQLKSAIYFAGNNAPLFYPLSRKQRGQENLDFNLRQSKFFQQTILSLWCEVPDKHSEKARRCAKENCLSREYELSVEPSVVLGCTRFPCDSWLPQKVQQP